MKPVFPRQSSMKITRECPILIMGMGSLVRTDDGFGVHVIRAMQAQSQSQPIPDHVVLLDAGTSVVDQTADLATAAFLICIDVAAGGESPGTMYRFEPGDITYRHSRFHDAHKINIFDTLAMVEKMRGCSLPTTIIAVEPENLGWGTDLTPTLSAKMEPTINLVWKEVHGILEALDERR